VTDPHKWVIHGERLVDDTPYVRVSLADVELPNQVRFTQYVFRMRRCAMTVVLDDAGERVLMMRRHRFIVDRWVWELPGGYVDDGEGSVTAAAREVEEETGWRPRETEFVMSCQPLIGNADYPQDLYLASGAERVGEPEVDETAEVRWVPVDETPAMIARGRTRGRTASGPTPRVPGRRPGAHRPVRRSQRPGLGRDRAVEHERLDSQDGTSREIMGCLSPGSLSQAGDAPRPLRRPDCREQAPRVVTADACRAVR
jgi:8-oxo-dGTP pyrophosphatase MutT (NUDIX family)